MSIPDPDDPNFRLLTVSEPWASALVRFDKKTEFRRSHLAKTIPLPAWVGIVSSRAAPKSSVMLQYRKCVKRSGCIEKRSTMTSNALVGLVRFDKSIEASPDDPWYISPSKGWMVGAAIAFEDPIENVAGSQTLNRKLSSHPDAERIHKQLLQRLKDHSLKLSLETGSHEHSASKEQSSLHQEGNDAQIEERGDSGANCHA